MDYERCMYGGESDGITLGWTYPAFRLCFACKCNESIDRNILKTWLVHKQNVGGTQIYWDELRTDHTN